MHYIKNIKLMHLLVLLLAAVGMTSCSETDSTSSSSEKYPNDFLNWQARNDTYFESVYDKAQTAINNGDTEWYIFKSLSRSTGASSNKTDYIVVHVLSQDSASFNGQGHSEDPKATGYPATAAKPLASDSVQVHYRGNLMPTDNYPLGKQFDTSWYGDYNLSYMRTTMFAVTGVIDGFATALQYMHIKDRWEVYIPYALGYGSTESTSIPAYSTLKFDITLMAINRQKQTL